LSVAEVTAPPLLLEGVSVDRGGRTVVDDVSMEIPAGEVTTLLGPNGAGKSSLVLGVAGVLKPRGRIALGDVDLTRQRPEKVRAAGVAVVPEGRRLLPDLTVEDNMRVATYSLGKDAGKTGIAYALELFPELEKRWTATAKTLSGGEQQMVVLAQALASRPKMVLVDELSLGLAPVVVKRLVPTLQAVAASGVGVLLIEQFAHVALALAQSAYVIEGGRIRYSGSAQELRENPDLLHSAYLLRGHAAVEEIETIEVPPDLADAIEAAEEGALPAPIDAPPETHEPTAPA
jgi:branched-chain amino acid transport system ATP-binding protein